MISILRSQAALKCITVLVITVSVVNVAGLCEVSPQAATNGILAKAATGDTPRQLPGSMALTQ